MGDDSIRVLHCHHLVGGQAGMIASSERALGVRSWAVSLESSPFGYEADEILTKPDASLLRREFARWGLLVRGLLMFDVLHYNFGNPILRWTVPAEWRGGFSGWLLALYTGFNRMIELPLLRLCGKVIAVTYQGDDARQGDYSLRHQRISIAGEVGEGYYDKRADEEKRRSIARFGEYADLIYSLNPDLLGVLPARAKFLPYGHIDPEKWGIVEVAVNGVPVVVHAPSHRGVKGTRHILAAVESLRRQGVVFEFRLIERMSRVEARRHYERADLVVDQLLAGWYGGLAVEAMALGKPVVCYLRSEDLEAIPPEMRRDLPLIAATPETIEDILREWITGSGEERRLKGLKGRRYVERWHDPCRIAERLVGDYREVLRRRALKSKWRGGKVR